MSYVDSQLSLYLVSALMGAGTAIAGPIFYAKVVSGWYSKNRGLALGLVLSAPHAAAVTVPVSQALMDSYGWHAAYRMLAVAAFPGGIGLDCVALQVFSNQQQLLACKCLTLITSPVLDHRYSAEGLTWPTAWWFRRFDVADERRVGRIPHDRLPRPQIAPG